MQNGRQMRITDSELELIKATYSNNTDLLKILRKVFLPEVTAESPIGQNIDLWLTLDIENLTPAEIAIKLQARNETIRHIEGCLVQLSLLAGQPNETVEQTKERLAKNSTK